MKLVSFFVDPVRPDGRDGDARFLASNVVEVSTVADDDDSDGGNGAEDDMDDDDDGSSDYDYEDGGLRSLFGRIDPSSIGDSGLSAAAKLHEVASRVSSGSFTSFFVVFLF